MRCGGRENSLHLARMLHEREGGPHLAVFISQIKLVYLPHKLQKIIFFTKPKLSKTEKNRTLYPVILGIAYQIER